MKSRMRVARRFAPATGQTSLPRHRPSRSACAAACSRRCERDARPSMATIPRRRRRRAALRPPQRRQTASDPSRSTRSRRRLDGPRDCRLAINARIACGSSGGERPCRRRRKPCQRRRPSRSTSRRQTTVRRNDRGSTMRRSSAGSQDCAATAARRTERRSMTSPVGPRPETERRPEKPKAPSVAGGAFGLRNAIYASGTLTLTTNGPRLAARPEDGGEVMVLLHAREMPQPGPCRQRRNQVRRTIAQRRGGEVTMPRP